MLVAVRARASSLLRQEREGMASAMPKRTDPNPSADEAQLFEPGARFAPLFSIVLFHDPWFRGANQGATPVGSETDPTFAKQRQTWGTKIETEFLL